MKFEVALTKVETKTVKVFGDSPEQAVDSVEMGGFKADDVTELLDRDEPGNSFTVSGHCELCSIVLLDDNYKSDQEGVELCNKCFDEIVAAADEDVAMA